MSKKNNLVLNKELILPAFEGNCVSVVLSSSDFYIPYTGVCIQSIVNNSNDSNHYDILIMERGVSESNKKKIFSIVKNYPNISIRFINIYKKIKNINFYVNGDRISQETYYGLLVPWILPKYEKVIIMDCDMILTTDIAKLYNQDISKYLGGGVKDVVLQGFLNNKKTGYKRYYIKELKIKNPYNCVNGGLILLNLKEIRNKYTLKYIKHLLQNYSFRVVDQDIINILIQNHAFFLDPRWNYMVYTEGNVKDSVAIAPKTAQDEYFKSRNNPYIIHYAGDGKPWIGFDVEFSEDFWSVARTTPFYEEILVRSSKKEGTDFTFNLLRNGDIVYYIPFEKILLKSIKKICDRVVTPFLPKDSKRRIFISKNYRKLLKFLKIKNN